MTTIKNIIFDLGGIFLTLDYQKTENAFTELGIKNFNDLFTQHHVSPLFYELEVGIITPHQFYDEFRTLSKINLTNQEIENAWNAMLLSFPVERLLWLENIRNKYNIYLFSNTNQIHYDCFMKIYKQQTGNIDFNNYFIKAYYSHELALRKPDAEAFEFILKEQNLHPYETLFIDDTFKNIEGAKHIGLRTIHLMQPKTVLDLNL